MGKLGIGGGLRKIGIGSYRGLGIDKGGVEHVSRLYGRCEGDIREIIVDIYTVLGIIVWELGLRRLFIDGLGVFRVGYMGMLYSIGSGLLLEDDIIDYLRSLGNYGGRFGYRGRRGRYLLGTGSCAGCTIRRIFTDVDNFLGGYLSGCLRLGGYSLVGRREEISRANISRYIECGDGIEDGVGRDDRGGDCIGGLSAGGLLRLLEGGDCGHCQGMVGSYERYFASWLRGFARKYIRGSIGKILRNRGEIFRDYGDIGYGLHDIVDIIVKEGIERGIVIGIRLPVVDIRVFSSGDIISIYYKRVRKNK